MYSSIYSSKNLSSFDASKIDDLLRAHQLNLCTVNSRYIEVEGTLLITSI